MNCRLIHSLGHPSDDVVYVNEQKGIQDEFYFLLNFSDTAPTARKFYKDSPGLMKYEEMQTLIREALNFDRRDDRYKKDELMGQAAVDVMISYYYQLNPEKFLQIREAN
ncbi:uncharacterized protein PGTG_19217 [Puccinia graminis f. sp. tritici CRL 75-36-700-3]|uniref:Uncharacterized protein n=1 Tax=Puccinia graminis f. sp. tritici (strain CRL 75-36-700-3 / race SCCL) TaxID=418459 RepID=E3L987_PUCGT|nr:uncharacterized protein PGTG_19217 [Puccinia graminis f. sp. tritici CRL 75-36-700-3]EFP93112.1 hypothetical protein PGTG_19217 [Puccinia graminis f. sp. tritici CRL 75-36-700-3]